MHDVVISGYYGFKNGGDDAILMAIISNLKEYKPDIKINVLSVNPEETYNLYGVDSVNRFNVRKVYNAIKECKLFINGGGSLLQDVTSTRSLLYYLGTIWLAKFLKKKVMLYANGIGPIRKKINARIVRKVVNKVNLITLREEYSLKEIKRLKINKPKILLTADPALTLEAASDQRIEEILENENIHIDKPTVCISIRKWSKDEKLSEIIAKTADYIKHKYNAHILFIPMQFPNDLVVINDIIKKMQSKSYVLNNRYSETEKLGIIKRTDLLIGMRLHALIYGVTMNVPVIGLSYDTKVDGFLNYVGQISAGDISDIKFEKLCEIIDDIWPIRKDVRLKLQQRTEELKKKAYNNAFLAIKLLKE